LLHVGFDVRCDVHNPGACMVCGLTDRAKLRAQAQGGGAANRRASQRGNAILPYL
jgi:hypothetical protein